MRMLWQNLCAIFRRGRDLKNNEDGQILVLTALSGLALVMMVSAIFNVGMVTGEKMKVQNAADAAAYSQAVWEARTLNFLAYTNRAIISHMVTIAFATAMISQRNLWEKAMAASGVPIIGQMIDALYTFWNSLTPVARAMQATAYGWIELCKVIQTAFLNEHVSPMQNRVASRVSRFIDPAIRTNQEVKSPFYKTAWALSKIAAMNEFGNLVGFQSPLPPMPRAMDFKDLKKVYEESMDGFSRGTSFPRYVTAPAGPVVLNGFRFRLRGNAVVEKRRIVQQERFLVDIGVSFLGLHFWETIVDVKIADEPCDLLQAGDFAMFNAQARAVRQENPFPSVYAFAQKRGQDIAQIRLLGAGTNEDVTALARAEVFYWLPDCNREKRSSKKYDRAREPNLFNPFWQARLAPLDEKLPFLPNSMLKYSPITH